MSDVLAEVIVCGGGGHVHSTYSFYFPPKHIVIPYFPSILTVGWRHVTEFWPMAYGLALKLPKQVSIYSPLYLCLLDEGSRKCTANR